MHIELLDDLQHSWKDIEPEPTAVQAEASLDRWFVTWARSRREKVAPATNGIFLIHANGCFTSAACRQDLQGVELLKHIRLTPWLQHLRTWHAIVYSFESIEHVLRRKPNDLILTSRGVSFVRLPEALDLKKSLSSAHPRKAEAWKAKNLSTILEELATNSPAMPSAESFRPFVACDYAPPDSAHEISNWWGIYEMWRALSDDEFLEYSTTQDVLPSSVRDGVTRLDNKKARWLAREPTAGQSDVDRQAIDRQLREVARSAAGKTLVYVDDEADKGWAALLKALVTWKLAADRAPTLLLPEPAKMALNSSQQLHATIDEKTRVYRKRITNLAKWIAQQNPDLLILDLRLLGRLEADAPPATSSGMEVAREVRRRSPYLPIVLFTASNKAETVVISQSLDIDDYWMKPGLGEHRAPQTRNEHLASLGATLSNLLGARYAWLIRIARAVRELREHPRTYWWEGRVAWPDGDGQAAGPEPMQKLRQRVVNLLEPMLYTVRVIIRLEEMFPLQAGDRADGNLVEYVPPPFLTERLQAGLCNQVGQVVELIHDGAKNSGVIGGAGDNEGYVFGRRDWWAFRLFAFRSDASHVTSVVPRLADSTGAGRSGDLDFRLLVSDLLAWLMTDRVEVKGIDDGQVRTIAASVARTRSFGRLPVTIFRLHPTDPAEGQRDELLIENCKSEAAMTPSFRAQLALRPEFSGVVAKSKALLDAS